MEGQPLTPDGSPCTPAAPEDATFSPCEGGVENPGTDKLTDDDHGYVLVAENDQQTSALDEVQLGRDSVVSRQEAQKRTRNKPGTEEVQPRTDSIAEAEKATKSDPGSSRRDFQKSKETVQMSSQGKLRRARDSDKIANAATLTAIPPPKDQTGMTYMEQERTHGADAAPLVAPVNQQIPQQIPGQYPGEPPTVPPSRQTRPPSQGRDRQQSRAEPSSHGSSDSRGALSRGADKIMSSVFGTSERKEDRQDCMGCRDCRDMLFGTESILDSMMIPYEDDRRRQKARRETRYKRTVDEVLTRIYHRAVVVSDNVTQNYDREVHEQENLRRRINALEKQSSQDHKLFAEEIDKLHNKVNDKDAHIRKMSVMIDMLQKGGLPQPEDDIALRGRFESILTGLKNWARYAARSRDTGVITPMTHHEFLALDADTQKLLTNNIYDLESILQDNASKTLTIRCMQVVLCHEVLRCIMERVMGLPEPIHEYLCLFDHGESLGISCTDKELHHWKALTVNLLTKSNDSFVARQSTAVDLTTDSLITRLAPLGAPGRTTPAKLREIVEAAADLSLIVSKLPFLLQTYVPTSRDFSEEFMADIVNEKYEADLAELDITILLCPAVLKYKFEADGSYNREVPSSVLVKAQVSCETFD